MSGRTGSFLTLGCALLLLFGPAACGGSDGWEGAAAGDPVTEAELRAYHEQQEPSLRAGALSGVWRLLQVLRGQPADGVRVTSTGPTSADFEIDMDLDGDGARETTMLIPGSFNGDPLDGLSDSDFPATTVIVDQQTPVGTWSANLTITSLGGDATGPTIFLVEGTSGRVDGTRVETSVIGYTVDLTFMFTPLFGTRDIGIVSGVSTADYELTYDSNTSGNQWLGVDGLVDGISFFFELWGPRN